MPTFLLYHRVLPRTTSPYAVSVPAFREQMRLLRESGRQVLDIDQVTAWLGGEGVSGGAVCVTFDDGCADLYEHALPILAEFSIPAVVFLTTGPAGTTVPFDGQPTSFLGWREAREMQAAGVSFQSHTVSHPDLTTLDESHLKRELTDSKQELEDRLGAPVRHLAYPYGRFNGRVQQAAREAGYDFAYAAGYSHGGALDVERMQVLGGDGLLAFRLKAGGFASRLRRLKNRLAGK